jgi:transcriptional regulator with XRE-family HTH domain
MPERIWKIRPPLDADITLDIRPWRDEAGLRLMDLVPVTGLSKSKLSRIELLECDPPLSLFVYLAREYHRDPYEFFGFVGFPRPHCCCCEKAKTSTT